MVSDWLKTQKKPTGTNQIRAFFLATKFKKVAVVFSKERFDFVCKTTIEQFSKKPEHSKKYVFLAKCIKNVVLREKYCQQNRVK